MRMDLARFDARSLLCFVHDQLYALGSFMRQYLASRCTSRMVQSTFRSLNVTMSIHRCYQLLLLWVLLCIFAMSCVQARQDAQVSKCAKNGQYCQVHWQCCSGKCMTYTYKCAPKVPQVLYDNKDSATGIEYLPELWRHVFNPTREQIDIVTLNDVYKINDNTIQSSEKAGNAHDSFNPPSTDSCLAVGQACSESRQCCRKRCHTYLHKCVT